MAKSLTKTLKKIVGIKKEEKKKNSKKKQKPKRNTKLDKKKKLKQQRLNNLKKAREKRKEMLKIKKAKKEKERKRKEKLNQERLRNLKKARQKRKKQLQEKRKQEKQLNKERLQNLKRARKIREQERMREKRLEETPEVIETNFLSYEKSIPKILNKANFKDIIKKEKKIILKPNLTKAKAFPTTTDPQFVEEIIKYIKKNNKKAKIIIAEGSGGSSTKKCFKKLGYEELAEKYDVELVDLNNSPTVKRRSDKMKKFKTINYPKVLTEGFLISLPVLKEHSKTKVTISLKNMLGCYPSSHYKTPGYTWKNTLHIKGIDNSIHDILTIRFPDYTICDASIAQLEHEINGFPKEIGTLIAGSPLEVDKKGALLLGYDWKRIKHLTLAEELSEEK